MQSRTRNALVITGIVAILAAKALWPSAVPSKPQNKAVALAPGTPLSVRLDREVGSKLSVSGQAFTARLARPVEADGQAVLPAGTEFSGAVLEATPAGSLAGGARLRLTLRSFSMNGQTYNLRTTTIFHARQGKGKRTVEMAGVGAGIGAVIGVLAGGPRGAAIGAMAGGGAGAAGSAFTSNHSRDIVLPAESLLNFRLAQPLTIVVPNPESAKAK